MSSKKKPTWWDEDPGITVRIGHIHAYWDCLVLIKIIPWVIYHRVNLQTFKKIFFIYFRQRTKEGRRGGEKHPCVVASHVAPTGDLAHNPGMGPDWELNRWPFGSQTGAQSTEPPQPGAGSSVFIGIIYKLTYREDGMQKRARRILKFYRTDR